MSAKLVSTFTDRWCFVVSATDSHGRILGFLDRNCGDCRIIYLLIYGYRNVAGRSIDFISSICGKSNKRWSTKDVKALISGIFQGTIPEFISRARVKPRVSCLIIICVPVKPVYKSQTLILLTRRWMMSFRTRQFTIILTFILRFPNLFTICIHTVTLIRNKH
jgi:hypothetical protein